VVVGRVRRLEVGRDPLRVPTFEVRREQTLTDALSTSIGIRGQEAEVGMVRLRPAAGLESLVEPMDRLGAGRRHDIVQQGVELRRSRVIELVLAGR
jgi:hypothetical protein